MRGDRRDRGQVMQSSIANNMRLNSVWRSAEKASQESGVDLLNQTHTVPPVRAFALQDSGRRISKMALQKLPRQSLGAVQQHHSSTPSCRQNWNAVTAGSVFLDG